MAARRVRRAHHGRLWRPARVATPTRPATGPARPRSRPPIPPATAQHQARPGRSRRAAKAPPPALTPAPLSRPGRRSGAPLAGRNARHPQAAARHQPQKLNGITGKGAGQQPATTYTYSTRRGPWWAPPLLPQPRCPEFLPMPQPQRSPGAREGHQAWRGCAQPDRGALRRPVALAPCTLHAGAAGYPANRRPAARTAKDCGKARLMPELGDRLSRAIGGCTRP
jgi:hypothetical protein